LLKWLTTLKTSVVKTNNMSSPFQKSFSAKSPITTSPLNGAYTEAKDGMVTVSYDDIHKDFQQGIADNVAKAYAPEENACSNLDQKLADGKLKEGAHKVLSEKCAKKNEGSFESVTGKKPFADVNKFNKTKPFEGAGVSDYKKSNKNNPFYIDNGYELPY